MRYDLQIADMVWSYSRLDAFCSCPYQWLLKYIYHEPSQKNFFSEYGTLVHDILRQYLKGELTAEELRMKFILGFFRISPSPPTDKMRTNYLEQGKQYFTDIQFPKRKILSVEEKSSFKFVKKPFIGFIDVLSEDDSGALCITDHKSRDLKPRSKRPKPTKTDEELDSYLKQLYVYSDAVHQKLGRYPDFLEFNCYRTGTWIREPFKMEAMEATRDWAAKTIETIESCDNWEPCIEYWMCNQLCDVRKECIYHDMG